MGILFVSSFAPIASDVDDSARLYRDALGLPLTGDDYLMTESLDGVKHFGLWSLGRGSSIVLRHGPLA